MTTEEYVNNYVSRVISEVASSFGSARDRYIRDTATHLGLSVQELAQRYTICEQMEPDWDLDSHTLRYRCTFWMEPRHDDWTAQQ